MHPIPEAMGPADPVALLRPAGLAAGLIISQLIISDIVSLSLSLSIYIYIYIHVYIYVCIYTYVYV